MPLAAVPLAQVSRALAEAFSAGGHGADEWLLMLQHEVRGGRADVARSVVALADGAAIGACIVSCFPGDTGRIGPTGVIRPWRRRGLGRVMVERAVGHLAAAGATRYLLEVARENRSAQSLYRGLGFQPVRALQTLVASRVDLSPPSQARVQRVEAPAAIEAAARLRAERPVFQRSSAWLASLREGVIAHAVGADGVTLQRGRALLDLAATPDEDVVRALAFAAAEVSWRLRLIHVTEDDPLRDIFMRIGFSVESEAVEMVATHAGPAELNPARAPGEP